MWHQCGIDVALYYDSFSACQIEWLLLCQSAQGLIPDYDVQVSESSYAVVNL